MKVNSDNTGLLVVDMQNDFCHPDGALYNPMSEAVIKNINTVICCARNFDMDVLFSMDCHTQEQFEGNHYYDEFDRWGEHVVDQWGTSIHKEIDYDITEDHAFTKPTYDAFKGTQFLDTLHERGIEDLIIVGTLANVCVMHTAASATTFDIKPIVLRDCVGYLDESHRQYALSHIDFLCGEVVDRNELQFK